MYSNISQILLVYKMWEYYNKFTSMKSFRGILLMCQIQQCGYMEHALKSITFYVQKHITLLTMYYNPPLVHNEP